MLPLLMLVYVQNLNAMIVVTWVWNTAHLSGTNLKAIGLLLYALSVAIPLSSKEIKERDED